MGKQGSKTSYDNLHHFPSQSSQPQDSDLGLSQDPFSFFHSLLSGAPVSPQHMPSSTHLGMSSANNNSINNTMLTVEQVCFCNNSKAPKDCAECYKTYGNVPCSKHTLVPCSNNPACQKVFTLYVLRSISANHLNP
jgi:hypothetical protein